MRSALGAILVLLGLATTVVLVLLLFQTIGLRTDLDRARGDVAALESQVASQLSAQEAGVTAAELQAELDALETSLRETLASGGSDGGTDGDVSQPAGGDDTSEIMDRLDQVLDRIEALDNRVTEICEGVPVC